jgi:hypothetical protein
MNIEGKTCHIRTWKKHLIFYIFSTNIDTLVPSLYQCVEARSIEVFRLLSQPLPRPFQPLLHQRNICHPTVKRFKRHTLPTVNRKYFFMNILCIETFFSQKRTTERCSFIAHPSSTAAILTTKTSL